MARKRMVSIAMLEGAMRYREAFWREDVESFEANGKEIFDVSAGKRSWAENEKILKRMRASVIDYQAKQVKLNNAIYDMIAISTEGLENKEGFDNYATGLCMCTEEFLKARNTTQIITLMKLYNQGLFDHLFTKPQNENHENTTTNNERSDDSAYGIHPANFIVNGGIVQEKQHFPAATEQRSGDDEHGDAAVSAGGHEQVRTLHDDLDGQGRGAEDEPYRLP